MISLANFLLITNFGTIQSKTIGRDSKYFQSAVLVIQTAHEFKHDGFVMNSMSARDNFAFLRNRLTESFELFEYKAVCLSDQQKIKERRHEKQPPMRPVPF